MAGSWSRLPRAGPAPAPADLGTADGSLRMPRRRRSGRNSPPLPTWRKQVEPGTLEDPEVKSVRQRPVGGDAGSPSRRGQPLEHPTTPLSVQGKGPFLTPKIPSPPLLPGTHHLVPVCDPGAWRLGPGRGLLGDTSYGWGWLGSAGRHNSGRCVSLHPSRPSLSLRPLTPAGCTEGLLRPLK